MSSERIKVAGAALNQSPIDWQGNLDNILQAIGQAQAQQVEILCLPELCITGYGCEDLFYAPWVSEKALQVLLDQVVPATANITVAVGLPFRLMGHLYNTTCLVSDKQILGFVAKQFLANDGVHYEHRWFTPWRGGKEFPVHIRDDKYPFGDIIFQHKGVRLAFEICEDAWRTDVRPAHRHYTHGVDLIMNPSASHFALGKTHLRQDLVVGSSRDFGCAYVFANHVGNEAGRMIYDGELLVADRGKLVAQNHLLGMSPVQLVAAEVGTTSQLEDTPALAYPTPHRPEEEFTLAAGLGLFDYMRKTRAQGFVLSLSGGADSASCAVLVHHMVRRAVEELGAAKAAERLGLPHLAQLPPEQWMSQLLLCLYQATENSTDTTAEAAKSLAASLGAAFAHWNIDTEVAGYRAKAEQVMGRPLTWDQDDLALQNIQSRTRTPGPWFMANLQGKLLLTTGNRSEGNVGYTTMDGDTSGSLAPIAGVSKSFLHTWLRYAQHKLGYAGLAPVTAQKPTAELRPHHQDQNDEADLMPYALMARIEHLAFVELKSPKQVLEALLENQDYTTEDLTAAVKKFFSLWARNQWKRERMAPSFMLDHMSIDPKGWLRFPILSGAYHQELAEL